MREVRWFQILPMAVFLFLAACGGGSGGGGTNATPIAAPAQLTVDPGDETSRVTLSWPGVNGAVSYNIYYSTHAGVTKTNSTKIAGFSSPYELLGLTNGTPYFFVVSAVGGNGLESAVSVEKTATPMALPPPLSPGNVHVDSGSGQLVFSWDASEDATSYNLYYATASGVTKAAVNKVLNVTSPYTLASLNSGVAYYAMITAMNANGESNGSFEVSGTPSASPPPAAPTGVQAVLAPGDTTKVVLSWNAAAGATRYNLYYSSAYPATKAAGTLVANVTSPWTQSGLDLNQAWFFVVTAVNNSGESAESLSFSATPRTQAIVAANQRMVSIPADSNFQFGDSSNADNITYAQPVKTLSISAFRMDRYETTYDLWVSVYNWAILHGYNFDDPGRKGSDNDGTDMPVTWVNWYDVVKWLNARSEMEGLTPAYYTDAAHTTVYRTGEADLQNNMVDWSAHGTATGYRLPTEAEFEKAERGGLVAKRWAWGDAPADPNSVPRNLANYYEGRSTSVGIYPANGYGLYDITGNVWEWTWNWETADYTDPGWSSATDPLGPSTPVSSTMVLRVRRGGGFTYGPAYMRNAERVFRSPLYTAPYFGFRSARSGG